MQHKSFIIKFHPSSRFTFRIPTNTFNVLSNHLSRGRRGGRRGRRRRRSHPLRPNLQDRVLQGVVVALPVIPVDPVAETLVLSTQVEPVQVGVVACRVPPGPGEPDGAVVAPGVVVAIDGAELGATSRKTLAEVGAEAVVEDPVGAESVGEPEFVDEEADAVALPVVEGDQQLHRLLVGQQEDALQAQPELVVGGAEAFLLTILKI